MTRELILEVTDSESDLDLIAQINWLPETRRYEVQFWDMSVPALFETRFYADLTSARKAAYEFTSK